jgi:hypothetical protein
VNSNTHKAFVRSHHEGYQPPGLTFTGLWPGRHVVFRYVEDERIPLLLADIMKNWAALHPDQQQDVSVQRTEPRPFLSAANDLFALFRNQNLVELGSEGLRRAIQFASRRAVAGEPEFRLGQRCTALVAAAFQASMLAAIVRHHDGTPAFEPEPGMTFTEYADALLEAGWREHPVGLRLLRAADSSDYSAIFPAPFAVDQRYATPKMIYEKLRDAAEFCLIGHYSYFNDRLVAVEKAMQSPRLSF